MKMTTTFITKICDKCHKPYKISVDKVRRRDRSGVANYCTACMKVEADTKRANYYSSLSESEKNEYKEKRNWYATASDEEKAAFAVKMKEISDSRTPEQIAEENRRNSEGLKKYWASATAEERARHIDPWKAGNARYWEGLTPEERSKKASDAYWTKPEKERQRLHDISSQNMMRYNNSVSKEKLDAIRRRNLKKASGKNGLHQKFENAFMSSTASSAYFFESEIQLTENDVTHAWDYGIYDENGELVMVVDLDGDFFHADGYDYNGIYSREEYDEARSISVPDGIKIAIIQELKFKKTFEMMIKMLLVDYETYVNDIFKMCRSMPFPNPTYTTSELCKSFHNLRRMKCNDKYHKDISLNTRLGDRVIQHFHPSIYSAHRSGQISPYDAWHDDKLLMECIRNRILYQTYLNPRKILQGFNIAKIAQKVSVFSAGRAKIIIHKYLSEFDEIFDPFSGFSGRMLGAASLGKRYIGQDISEIHVRESNKIIEFLRTYTDTGRLSVDCKNILDSTGKYQCLFTCPPYSDKEQWLDVPVDRRTCDEWIDECLRRFSCKRYVFVVDSTEKYKEYIADVITNKSALGTNYEYVICIDEKVM